MDKERSSSLVDIKPDWTYTIMYSVHSGPQRIKYSLVGYSPDAKEKTVTELSIMDYYELRDKHNNIT